MKVATLLVIVLSNQGYWFAGQPATIILRPAVEGGPPDAQLFWELKFNGFVLDKGKAALGGFGKETEVHLNLPNARVRVTLQWHYRVMSRDGVKELETGDVPIFLFPNDLTGGLASRVGKSRIVVWDEPDGLPKLLDMAKIPFTRISSSAKLQLISADVVLVGQEQLDDSPFEQSPLLNLAQSGASVMIFRQTTPSRLAGYPLARRSSPVALDSRMNHPLLAGLEPQDLHSWIAVVPTLDAVQLPPDEPVLEIASYAREVPGKQPAPIDAILLSKSAGKGRIVLCQIPLGDWTRDPRSQILLANSIDYLLTRPQPTPRPSERLDMQPQPIPTKGVPTNQIFPGAD